MSHSLLCISIWGRGELFLPKVKSSTCLFDSSPCPYEHFPGSFLDIYKHDQVSLSKKNFIWSCYFRKLLPSNSWNLENIRVEKNPEGPYLNIHLLYLISNLQRRKTHYLLSHFSSEELQLWNTTVGTLYHIIYFSPFREETFFLTRQRKLMKENLGKTFP